MLPCFETMKSYAQMKHERTIDLANNKLDEPIHLEMDSFGNIERMLQATDNRLKVNWTFAASVAEHLID